MGDRQWTAAGAGALGAADLGMAQALLTEVTINPTTELPELTGQGNRILEGPNKTLCARSQKKGETTPQEMDTDLPMSVQEYPAEAWVSGGLLQDEGH